MVKMYMSDRRVLWSVLGVIVIGVALLWSINVLVLRPQGAASPDEAIALVKEFGTHLNNVSLLSPDASSIIAAEYGRFVTPELLAAWTQNPQLAPGHTVSSPWPARIEVDSTSPQGEGYVAQARVILKSSATSTSAEEIPAIIQIVRSGGGWKIAAFQEQKTAR